ncbi:unnamed protein product [Macrosiphum euphorbiae]|uniref:PiggyBac transposable element-derived protein domain-containing protein n=1 Tax=Macrosiphum euphorbiae TaxID=13131 RepID=A0AAV0WN84_9HEMI|nr:unnamed protein product [Macrosiphum euphorbiae]
MNDDEIVQALYSSDDLSEFDDSDADPDFVLDSDTDDDIIPSNNSPENHENYASDIDNIASNNSPANHENYASDTDNIIASNSNTNDYASVSSTSDRGPINNHTSSPVFNPEFFGINPDILETLYDGTPYDFYCLFIDDEVLNLLLIETNRYARNLLLTPRAPKSRLSKWVDVDIPEIKTFLGIVMWMGLNPLPSLARYWCKNEMYQSHIPKYMTRNRFELLLRTFHCSNNQTCPRGDRLY